MPRALSQANPDEGGDNRQWQRKPRAGRRRPARNGKLTSPVKKKGAAVAPFSISIADSSCSVQPRVQSSRRRLCRPTPAPADHVARLNRVDDLHAVDDRPKTVYFASRCGCGECVMKNWLPPVSAQSSAIPTVPRRYGTLVQLVADRSSRVRLRRRRADRRTARRSSAPPGARSGR